MDMAQDTIMKEKELATLLARYQELYAQENSDKALPQDFADKKKKIIRQIRDFRYPQYSQLSRNNLQRLDDALNRLSEIWAIQQTGVAPKKDFTFEIRQLKDFIKEERAHNKSLQNVDFMKYSKLDKIIRFKTMQRALRIKKQSEKQKEKNNLPSLWKLSWNAFKDNWKNTSGYKAYIGFSTGFSLVHGFSGWITGFAIDLMNVNLLRGGLGLKSGVFLHTGINAVREVVFNFMTTQRDLVKINILNQTLAKEIKDFRKNSSRLFLMSKSSSQITTFLTEKSSAYAEISTGIINIGRAVATAASALGVLITAYPEFGTIGAGIGLCVGGVGGYLWKSFNAKAQQLKRKASNIKSNRIETITNAAHDKGSVREAQVDRDIKIDTQREAELQNTPVKSQRHLTISIDSGLTLGCTLIATLFADRIGLQGGVGDIITFSGSLVASSWAAFQGIQAYLEVHKNYALYTDATKQLMVPENMRIKTGQEKIPYKDNVIEMRDVQFSYDKSQKQMDMGKQSLVFVPGKLQCIVGDSGGGKTTLTDLMTHVRDIDHGQVIINGVNVDTTSEEEISKHVCLHRQNSEEILFNKIKSVRHNIELYIPKIDDVQRKFKDGEINQSEYLKLMDLAEHPQEHIDKALELACIKDAYYKIRDGKPAYECTIGEFSPGQRQRLALACSFLEDRDIYIFDEPTSALDTPTAINVLYNLKKLAQEGKNVIAITHTEKLIPLADNVTIIEGMNITAHGEVMDLYPQSSYLQKTFFSPSEILRIKCKACADNGEDDTAMRYELSYMEESEGKFNFIRTALKSGEEEAAQDKMQDFIQKIKEFAQDEAPVTEGEKAVYCHLARLVIGNPDTYKFYLETAHRLENKGTLKDSKAIISDYKEKARQDGVKEKFDDALTNSAAAITLKMMSDKVTRKF